MLPLLHYLCNIIHHFSSGQYGIKFLSIPNEDEKTKEYLSFVTSRPGFRLWSCDRSGDVIQTLLYKDLIDSAPLIPLPLSFVKERLAINDFLRFDFGMGLIFGLFPVYFRLKHVFKSISRRFRPSAAIIYRKQGDLYHFMDDF